MLLSIAFVSVPSIQRLDPNFGSVDPGLGYERWSRDVPEVRRTNNTGTNTTYIHSKGVRSSARLDSLFVPPKHLFYIYRLS